MHAYPVMLGLLALSACTSPEKQDAVAYVNHVQPLLVENGVLADRVLQLSADVYNNTAKSDKLLTAWQTDVVPLAEHLQYQAALTELPLQWRGNHEGLVGAWSNRAAAYRGLSEALILFEPEQWKAAREQADKAKVDEERWFSETNALLAPYGLVLDQYP